MILTHPDDPEFFCGATLAKWAELGLNYCLLAQGEKGTNQKFKYCENIKEIRRTEQLDTGNVRCFEKFHGVKVRK